MGNGYEVGHIAENHNTEIICIPEEPQQKYRIGTSVIDYCGVEHVLLDQNPRLLLLQWFISFGPHEGFLTHQ